MSPGEWALVAASLLLAVTVVFVVLAAAYSPEPPEDSPYDQ